MLCQHRLCLTSTPFDQVNARLPPNIQIEKHIIRDLIKGLDEIKNKGTAANETTTTEQITTPNVALKPRDEAFDELTKQFFIAYRSLERKYLLNLDSEIEKQVRSGADGKLIYPDTYPAVSLRHHVEILLTLRGINPSTIMIKPHHDDSVSRVLTGVVLQCLVPLIESHELESYGFRLHYIVNCDLAGDGRIEGAWVFADAESLKWPLVRDLFFKWTPGRFVPARIAGAALGYPVQYPMGDTVIVKLLDDTEQRFIQKVLGKKVSYVQAFGFPVGDGSE